MNHDLRSLSHTKWKCEYHIIFTPLSNRKKAYNLYKDSIRDILKFLCKSKDVEILGGYLKADYVHMLVSIPPKISVSNFVGFLKGKSSFIILNQHSCLDIYNMDRHFWSEGYLVSTDDINNEMIEDYLKFQTEKNLN